MRMEYINILLDAGKTEGIYAHFISNYAMSDYGFDGVTAENMVKLMSLKTEKEIKATKKQLKGFPAVVTLHRGEGDRSTPLDKAWSWTTDINWANFFATRMSENIARIYTATVPKNKIAEYIGGGEYECLVSPKDITVVDTIEMYGLDFLKGALRDSLLVYQKVTPINPSIIQNRREKTVKNCITRKSTIA
jgi:hypothetical protein